jgi:glycosidase/uncharacterized protein YjdB
MRKRILIPLIVSIFSLGACSDNTMVINPAQEVDYVDLSNTTLSLAIGETQTLTALSSDGGTVNWANSDSTVVRLTHQGNVATVSGLAKGSANIIAIHGGKSAVCTVTVGGGNVEPTISLTLSPTSKQLFVNDEFILNASVSGSTNPVTFSSSDNSVATVESKDNVSAKVKGVSEGLATIIAKVGTKTASCSVTVVDPESDIYISLDKSTLTMVEGTSDVLSATYRPASATVTWGSSDPSVVEVTNGNIRALKAGSADISATVTSEGDTRTATCHVTVTASGGESDYDAQIAAWSKPGHLYFHYLRKTDSDYDKWAIWAWPNYPDDGEGSLWGASHNYDQKGITPQTWGWMTNADCGGEGTEPYSDQFGQVMDLVLDQSLIPGGVVGGRTGKPAPLIGDYLWTEEYHDLFLSAAIGFLVVDQTKMDGSDMWTSDGGAESYIKRIGRIMPSGKDGYLHVYAVEGAVSDFKTTSGTQTIVNPTATDTTGQYRSKNDITNLKYDAFKAGVSTSTSFLNDRPGTGYQIFVPSFCDSNGDGYGDIKGITSKLDYLEDLGIDVLWLTPIQESNSYHGYDVTDYYKIDQRFGTLKDYQELLYKAHAKGMKVLMDMVINHTSKSNVLYKKSQRAETETINGKTINYRDMYVWKYKGDKILEWNGVEASDPKKPYGVDNPATFVTKNVEDSSDWYRDGTSNYYYYGKFGSGMAELNYSCQATRDYMTDMCKYWLSFGLDGFRLDAIKHIYLLSELDPTYNYSGDYVTYDVGYRTYYNPELGREIKVMNDYTYDRDLNVMFWKQFAGTIKAAYPNCFLVGENFDGWNARIAPFYEAIDSQFDFSTYYHLHESTISGGGITAMGGDITATLGYNAQYRSKAINGAFTSNHDVARLLNHAATTNVSVHHAEVNSSNWEAAKNRAKWFAAVTLLSPGLSWIYYGDEIGLCGNLGDKIQDVDDHGNNVDRWYRQPMRWGTEYGKDGVVEYGFGGLDVLWDSISSQTPIVSAQQQDPNSMYNFFKAVCHVKGDSRFPTYGSLEWTGTMGGDTNTISMKISDGSRSVIVFINASSTSKEIEAHNQGPKIGGSYGSTDTTVPAYGFVVVQK